MQDDFLSNVTNWQWSLHSGTICCCSLSGFGGQIQEFHISRFPRIWGKDLSLAILTGRKILHWTGFSANLYCWINPTIPRHSIPWQKVDMETPFNLRVRSQSRPLWPVRTRWLPPVASQRGGGRDAKSNLHFWPKKISTKKWPKNDPK